MTLPNMISLARLLSVPFNIWLIMIDHWRLALIVFCLAGLSDAIDGFLAKKFNMQSRLGRYLDPIADKVLLVSMFIVLGVQGDLPLWLVILVVSRDILLGGGLLLLYLFDQPYEPQPLFSSKVNTGVQIVLVGAVIALLGFPHEEFGPYLNIFIFATALTTVFSGTEYLMAWWRRMNKLEQD